jgi:hypothetical protein
MPVFEAWMLLIVVYTTNIHVVEAAETVPAKTIRHFPPQLSSGISF